MINREQANISSERITPENRDDFKFMFDALQEKIPVQYHDEFDTVCDLLIKKYENEIDNNFFARFLKDRENLIVEIIEQMPPIQEVEHKLTLLEFQTDNEETFYQWRQVHAKDVREAIMHAEEDHATDFTARVEELLAA